MKVHLASTHARPAVSRPRRAWWALVLIGAGTLWMLLVACLFLTGYWATVTVTGGDGEGFCDVVWQDTAGAERRGEGECYDESPGSRFDVRVTGWPAGGDPTLAETYVLMGVVFGLPPVAVGAAGVVHRSRRERELATRLPGTSPAGAGGADAAVSAPPTAAVLRRADRHSWWLLAASAVGAGVLLGLFSLSLDSDSKLRDTGVTTVGTVDRVDPDGSQGEGSAYVEFTADGDTGTRQVSLGGYADEFVEGQVVDVVYDPADPDRFTIDDVPYGSDWWSVVVGFLIAAVTGSGMVAVRSRAAQRRTRRLLRSHAWTPVRVRVLCPERGSTFTTADGTVWRSRWDGSWPTPNREPRKLSGWGLPDEDASGVSTDQAAWWVSDGTTAVFSPDQGEPLVVVRRRP